MESDILIIALLAAIVGGFILGSISYGVLDKTEIQELGQSICDQEYRMDFDSYDDKELKCKPKEIKAERQYDGIVVQIK